MRKYLPIIFAVLIAFLVRSIFLLTDSISFHYDMARDAFAVLEIWKGHHLKILGPPTSTPGLFHGVLYYYFLAPFYLIGKGDPRFPIIFLSFFNSLAIIPTIILAKKILKDKKWIFLSSIFFIFSYEAIQYGSWLSNPAPAFFSVGMFFLSLKLWEENNDWGLPLAGLFAAISSQFQFFLISLFFLLPVFKYLFKTKVSLKSFSFFSLFSLFGLSTLIIAFIKFGTFGQVFGGLSSIMVSQKAVSEIMFSDVLLNYLNHFANLFINNFIPINIFLGGLLGLTAIYFSRNNKFILFCLLSNLPIFLFGGHSSNYANVGLIIPAILAVVLIVKNNWEKYKTICILLIFLIISSNIFVAFKNVKKGQTNFVIPKDMILSKQLKIIDKTYEISRGKPFSINTLTLPIWTNTTWAYLYGWYGKKNYGYIPSFYGRDQTGMPGGEELILINKPLDISFFIIEPKDGIPEYLIIKETEAEDAKTKLVEEFSEGEIKLQLRKPI